MTKSTAWYARRYIERFGMRIVPIEPKRKFPRAADWGNNTLSDPEKADEFYAKHPDWNMGVALGPSRLCSLDIDCMESFRVICECYGIDLDDLIKRTPTLQGQAPGMRLMFRVPEGAELPYVKMNWRPESDPTGDIHRQMMADAAEAKRNGDTELENKIREDAKQHAMYTVFEFRSSTDGKQRQDVIAPSIHPETGLPYKWITQPMDDWPEPPRWLMAMWQEFDKFKPQLKAMCPWSVEPEIPDSKIRAARPVNNSSGGGNVISEFNRSVSLESSLTNYGYTAIGKRWLSPHSGTQLPGVVLFPDGNSCWIHHASDPLCSGETGKPVNAFDLYCYYDHSGDIKKAVKTAAEQLGMRPMAPVSNASNPEVPDSDSHAATLVSEPSATLPANWGSRDYMSPLPWTTPQGKPLKHIDNLAEICIRLGINIRYNVISKEEEILIPGKSFSMDNKDNAAYEWLKSECSMFDFPTEPVGGFLTYIADQNQFNPVATWIESSPWDGVVRMTDLYATITAAGESDNPLKKSLKETLIKRWMMSAVAAAFSPEGVSAAGVLVFQGGQYMGKTKWFKSLVPDSLNVLKDGMLLRPDDKDSIKQICSFWLVELGELDSTFRKSDIAALKSFITNSSDVLRRPYARKESKFARRTVFFGSVNPREFLHDQTGNRRYWTIECEDIDHTHGLDMQQIWAEALYMWRNGEGFYLTHEEITQLNTHNEEFMTIDPVEQRIMSGLDWSEPKTVWRWEQATSILLECGIDRPTRADASTAGLIIRKLNGDQGRKSNGKSLLFCPPKKVNMY